MQECWNLEKTWENIFGEVFRKLVHILCIPTFSPSIIAKRYNVHHGKSCSQYRGGGIFVPMYGQNIKKWPLSWLISNALYSYIIWGVVVVVLFALYKPISLSDTIKHYVFCFFLLLTCLVFLYETQSLNMYFNLAIMKYF